MKITRHPGRNMSNPSRTSRSLPRVSCVVLLALVGCYRSTSVDLPPEERLIFVESSDHPFDDDVIGMSPSREGLHVAVDRSVETPTGYVARHALLGVSQDTSTTYQHSYPDHARITAPLSDALGRPTIVVDTILEPVDLGGGLVVPTYIRGHPPTLVASYDERGTLRRTFEVGDASTDYVVVHDFDVADDGTIVVCGYSHLERRRIFVRVFEPDGETRALTFLDLPPVAPYAQCAIAADGSVLAFGAQADINDPAADIRNPGLTLFDRNLDVVMPSIRFSDGDIEIMADPRGFFIVQCRHDNPHLVDTTAYPAPSTIERASVIAIVSASGVITHVHEFFAYGNDPRDELQYGHVGRPNRDTQNSLVRFAYQGQIDGSTEVLDTSTAVLSALMVEFDRHGALDRPFSIPYETGAIPEFALTVGRQLWLIDARDRRLSIARYVWRRTLDR